MDKIQRVIFIGYKKFPHISSVILSAFSNSPSHPPHYFHSYVPPHLPPHHFYILHINPTSQATSISLILTLFILVFPIRCTSTSVHHSLHLPLQTMLHSVHSLMKLPHRFWYIITNVFIFFLITPTFIHAEQPCISSSKTPAFVPLLCFG